MLIISEGGLFTLMLRSRDAMKRGTLSHRFRRWVTSEVLPALRGARNIVPSELSHSAVPEAIRLRMVEQARRTFGSRAAGQLWFTLNLPVVPAMRVPPSQLELLPLLAQ